MLTSRQQRQAFRALNPLFNNDELNFGLSTRIVRSGCAIFMVEDRHQMTWTTCLAMARAAGRHGHIEGMAYRHGRDIDRASMGHKY